MSNARALSIADRVKAERSTESTTPKSQAQAKAVLEKAKLNEPAITRDVTDALHAAAREAHDPSGRLHGLEYRLKGEGSLARKLASSADLAPVPEDERPDHIHDAVRYTAMFDKDHYADGVKAMVAHLQDKGYTVDKVKNTWLPVHNGYRGLNMRLVAPSGQRFELQAHTPDSMAVKDDNHKLYEATRLFKPDERDDRKDFMERQMTANSVRIPTPKGVEQLSNYDASKSGSGRYTPGKRQS